MSLPAAGSAEGCGKLPPPLGVDGWEDPLPGGVLGVPGDLLPVPADAPADDVDVPDGVRAPAEDGRTRDVPEPWAPGVEPGRVPAVAVGLADGVTACSEEPGEVGVAETLGTVEGSTCPAGLSSPPWAGTGTHGALELPDSRVATMTTA